MASISGVLQDNDGNDLYPYTFDQEVLDANNVPISQRLGSASEASAVAGSSAFAKINTLSNLIHTTRKTSSDVSIPPNVTSGSQAGYVEIEFDVPSNKKVIGVWIDYASSGAWVTPSAPKTFATANNKIGVSIACRNYYSSAVGVTIGVGLSYTD